MSDEPEQDEAFVPRAVLDAWTVPAMPDDMKERVMLQLQEPWRVSVGPATAVATGRSHMTTFIAVTALAASLAAIALGLMEDRDDPPAPVEPAVIAEPVLVADPPAPEDIEVRPVVEDPVEPRRERVTKVEARIVGALTRDEIRRVVRANLSDVRHCYNAALVRDPKASGRVVIDFTVGADGRVVSCTLTSSTVPDPKVGPCIVDAAKRWVYPTPADGHSVAVQYPFLLEPG